MAFTGSPAGECHRTLRAQPVRKDAAVAPDGPAFRMHSPKGRGLPRARAQAPRDRQGTNEAVGVAPPAPMPAHEVGRVGRHLEKSTSPVGREVTNELPDAHPRRGTGLVHGDTRGVAPTPIPGIRRPPGCPRAPVRRLTRHSSQKTMAPNRSTCGRPVHFSGCHGQLSCACHTTLAGAPATKPQSVHEVQRRRVLWHQSQRNNDNKYGNY